MLCPESQVSFKVTRPSPHIDLQTLGDPEQLYPASIVHELEHPSPET